MSSIELRGWGERQIDVGSGSVIRQGMMRNQHVQVWPFIIISHMVGIDLMTYKLTKLPKFWHYSLVKIY